MDCDERRDSQRKRRRLSERRRAFGRAMGDSFGGSRHAAAGSVSGEPARQDRGGRDSPLAPEGSKIQMKIQFHITWAPDNEPLLVELSRDQQAHQPGPKQAHIPATVGEHIHERLSSGSVKRRQQQQQQQRQQQLLSIHAGQPGSEQMHSEDNLLRALGQPSRSSMDEPLSGGRDGVRSSTITGCTSDEDTLRFLAQHRQQRAASSAASGASGAPEPPGSSSVKVNNNNNSSSSSSQLEREHIYFKRDGQRFGNEFTLKLGVERSYRCLLKVRPLVPVQAISIQGQQVLFVDCSSKQAGARLGSHSAPASACSLAAAPTNTAAAAATAAPPTLAANNFQAGPQANQNSFKHHSAANGLARGSTEASFRRRGTLDCDESRRQRLALASDRRHSSGLSLRPGRQASQGSRSPAGEQLLRGPAELYEQQQSQMRRHFALSHCSSSANSHLLGSQLIYMFDWSAQRFEPNQNKARTQLQLVLKFHNGQIISLPLQVKFYQPERRQHLNWGSQLHFIDYDCSINDVGHIDVERIQFY